MHGSPGGGCSSPEFHSLIAEEKYLLMCLLRRCKTSVLTTFDDNLEHVRHREARGHLRNAICAQMAGRLGWWMSISRSQVLYRFWAELSSWETNSSDGAAGLWNKKLVGSDSPL